MITTGIGARIRGADGRIWGTVSSATELTWIIRGGPGPARKHEKGLVWFWEEDWLDFIEAQMLEEQHAKEVDCIETRKMGLKLEKKLREIAALEKRKDAGENLAPNQLRKMEGKAFIEEELKSLSLNACLVAVNVSVTTPGGDEVIAATSFNAGTTISTLAENAASAMGCVSCCLISDAGILPAQSSLEQCGIVDGTNLTAVMIDNDIAVITQYFSRALLRSLTRLPPTFSLGALIREKKLELCPNSGKLLGLHFGTNLVQEPPREIGLLTHLKRLSLFNVHSLPGEIGNLSSLEELVIQDGTIDRLPREIGQLHSLRIIRLVALSHLKELPDEIEELENLEVLEITEKDRFHYRFHSR